MNDINLQLVREFFELNLFRVLTHWQREQVASEELRQGSQLFVENARPVEERELDLVLAPSGLRHISRAIVEVRAWHSDRLYASFVRNHQVFRQFADPRGLLPVQELFGTNAVTTILVISELPVSHDLRNEALQSVREAGIDHLIEFPTILQDLMDKVSIDGSFTASFTLQTIQLLKRYRMLRNQQTEFSFPMEGPLPPAGSEVETVEAVEETEGDGDEA